MCAVLGAGSPVEIRCHPTCPWTGGWEICDVVVAAGDFGYRVRRVGLAHPLALALPPEYVRLTHVLALGRAG